MTFEKKQNSEKPKNSSEMYSPAYIIISLI